MLHLSCSRDSWMCLWAPKNGQTKRSDINLSGAKKCQQKMKVLKSQ